MADRHGRRVPTKRYRHAAIIHQNPRVMDLVPDHIADMAKRALALYTNVWHWPLPESPEDLCAVLADWLEECGDDLTRYLRPMPTPEINFDGFKGMWISNRNWVLRSIIEAHEKRDAIAKVKHRQATREATSVPSDER